MGTKNIKRLIGINGIKNKKKTNYKTVISWKVELKSKWQLSNVIDFMSLKQQTTEKFIF